ncbi:TonB-dependent receptor [Massilia dura]|uniref:TonB-dependent receptor n=1 Tax=Pseudoduganella dura TaxID=321982 RepID=A0A6I3X2J3_9BURK|nr:TonB-dependent receptor [Pseudoduganella dura]MUI11039.1 TonB-dependent receptor [Pseudoduganella dura]GGY14196.1 TonB-dependent receptor [Pseudoduganella dura]
MQRQPTQKTRIALAVCALAGVCQGAAGQQAQQPVQAENVVTVTGTSIRGVAAVGSDVTTIRREDIAATGATTSTELLRSVPEMNNFSASGINNGQNQANFVDQPAIHGIGVGNGGAGLTLVLLDGHRLPGAGINQTAPDAGAIPTSILERVEVMADGGSAIYGSDAVAGVINFVPRKSFNGAETKVRFGSADGYRTKNFSHLVGHKWDGGHALAAIERSENSALDGYARSYAIADQRRWGGPDTRSPNCTPGTASVGGVNYPITGGGALVPGDTSRCETNRGNDLYPAQRRDQAFFSVRQDVGESTELYASFLYSGRTLDSRVDGGGVTSGGLALTVPASSPFYLPLAGAAAGAPQTVTYNPSGDFGAFTNRITTSTRSLVAGANVQLPNEWNAKVEFNYGIEKDDVNNYGINQALAIAGAANGTFNPTGIGAQTSAGLLAQIGNFVTRYNARHTLKDAQVKLDGPLFQMGGGKARAALGAGTRREAMEGLTSAGPAGGEFTSAPYTSKGTRDDDSVFGELYFPVVGDANAFAGVRKLDVSVAARYDRYSDVGSTTNPKFGANWTVADGVKVRLSAGRSFHAPSLADAPSAIDTRVIRADCNPAQHIGCANAAPSDYAVWLAGGNNLKPEKANTYNLGLDLGPELLGGFKVGLTYFRIDYKDVITFPTFGVLTNPIDAYAPYRILRPAGATDAQWRSVVEPLLAGMRHDGLVYPDVGLPYAVYDLRRQNFADEKIQGIDYNIEYLLRSTVGQWKFGLSGSHMMKFDQNVPGVAETIELLDTNYAVRNKVRLQAGLVRGSFSASLFANHVGTFRNTGVTPVQRVSSFNTVDGHFAWNFKDRGMLDNTTLAIDVTNLFDRNPPVFYTGGSILGFDGNTANPLGRVISASLTKRW